MTYTTELLKHRVTIQNRKEAVTSDYGRDGNGIEWEDAATVWASVDFVKGKRAMNEGAIDVYGVVLIRMRWNCIANPRSHIVYDGQTYQVLGETFHADRQENTIQFNAQIIVNND